MQTWIALFRGINVGGNNILPMAELRSGLEALKFQNVRSYIQSGNVVFESSSKSAASLGKRIAGWVEEGFGFRPQVLLLKREDLLAAVEQNPFPGAISEPKTLHFSFLATTPSKPDHAALERAKAATERYALVGSVFYLHAPDGIGRSKLAASAEKHLGVVTTSRNYNSVDKLLTLVSQS